MSRLLYKSGLSAARPGASLVKIDYFRGSDLGRSALNVDPSRSPDSKNMLRDELGQVRKRMGYRTAARYEGAINGAFVFDDRTFIHAGTGLYLEEARIGEMADGRSQGWTLDGKLYLLDGTALRVLSPDGEGGYTLAQAAASAYVPKVIISRDPTGGGTAYEGYNLIGAAFTNDFYGTEKDTAYQLTDDGLDETPVTAKLLQEDGSWKELTEGADFTVDRATGVVTFASPPGVSPVTGEDNLSITAAKTREGYADRINKCTVSTLYGVAGAADRLFVSGNPDYPNRDWYSAQNDPTMFADLSYSVLGQDSSAIVGYSVVANRLAAHKDEAEDGRNVILRSGELGSDGQAAFPIVNTLIGEGAAAPFSHRYIGKEPLFLTRRGIYAVTAEDVTGEKYSQVRSAFLNARLVREEGLENAVSAVYDDFYMLFLNGRVYCLDGLQKSYSKNQPYSSFQYEGYLLDNIPARTVWTADGALWFGTGDGRVCRFYTDKTDPASYNDDGAPIEAHWDTPYFAGKLRHSRKIFRYLSATLAPSVSTSLTVYARRLGLWTRLFCDNGSARYFDFDNIDFGKLSFSTDTSPRNIRKRIRVGVVDKAQFRLENNELNEPFGVYDLTAEFVETGKF